MSELAKDTRERWDEWAKRQLTDEESAAAQLRSAGVSVETSLLIVMLGKIHNTLCDIEEKIDPPDDEWRET